LLCNATKIKMSQSLRAVLMKQGASLPVEELVPFVELLHEAYARVAEYDHQHESWLSERCFPAGIISLLPRKEPLALPVPQVDSSQLVPSDAAAKAAAAASSSGHPLMILQFSAGVHALSGLGSPTCGHVQPLIPAPDFLLCSPQHPSFPMQPTMWIPFVAHEHVTHFFTPYHRGLFHARIKFAELGESTPQAERKPLYRLAGSSNGVDEGAFEGVVHFGSVVCFKENDSEPEQQGVVVLTYVRLSTSANARFRQTLDQSESVLMQALAGKAPEAMVAVLPLQRPAGFDDGKQCWQEVAKDRPLLFMRTCDITHIWHADALGEFGCSGYSKTFKDMSTRPMLKHREALQHDRLTPLPNPAQATPLRHAIEAPSVTAMLLDFVLQSEQTDTIGSEHAAADFIESIRLRASLLYPIDTLLCARARINCARPLDAPGIVKQRLLGAQSMEDEEDAEDAAAAEAEDDEESHRSRKKKRAGSTGKRASGKRSASASVSSIKSSKKKSKNPSRSRAGSREPRASAQKAKKNRQAVIDDDAVEGRDVPSRAGSGKSDGRAAEEEQAAMQVSDAEADSESEEDDGMAAARELYEAASDVFTTAEHFAPLAGFLYFQCDSFQPSKLVKNKAAMQQNMQPWQRSVWNHLSDRKSVDAELFTLICNFAAEDKTTIELAAELAKPTWRATLRAKTGSKAVQPKALLIWCYNDGQQPDLHAGSVWEMHYKGVWYPPMPSVNAARRGAGVAPTAATTHSPAAPAAVAGSRKRRPSDGARTATEHVVAPEVAAAAAAGVPAAKRIKAGTGKFALAPLAGPPAAGATSSKSAAAAAAVPIVTGTAQLAEDVEEQQLLQQIAAVTAPAQAAEEDDEEQQLLQQIAAVKAAAEKQARLQLLRQQLAEAKQAAAQPPVAVAPVQLRSTAVAEAAVAETAVAEAAVAETAAAEPPPKSGAQPQTPLQPQQQQQPQQSQQAGTPIIPDHASMIAQAMNQTQQVLYTLALQLRSQYLVGCTLTLRVLSVALSHL
jgi:hypothetical protein